ncbi:hypothetical protein BDP27DRAFT_1405776 [Rhodocollybia butyracea]|uniref:Uncharacterized protein n=1 Tax=Rhodocollybia butyracea TaxID=206335 RepID=A0A9P5U2E0_9AGAR|nr:hypothetical protein BDP27DRAFT_1405776 [Rhodocollybia butyracea]
MSPLTFLDLDFPLNFHKLYVVRGDDVLFCELVASSDEIHRVDGLEREKGALWQLDELLLQKATALAPAKYWPRIISFGCASSAQHAFGCDSGVDTGTRQSGWSTTSCSSVSTSSGLDRWDCGGGALEFDVSARRVVCRLGYKGKNDVFTIGKKKNVLDYSRISGHAVWGGRSKVL